MKVYIKMVPFYFHEGPPSCVCGKKMACQGVSNNFVGFKVTQTYDLSSVSCHSGSAMFVIVNLYLLLSTDPDKQKFGSLEIFSISFLRIDWEKRGVLAKKYWIF